MEKLFRDRSDAGRQLAAKLSHYSGKSNVLVLGLPRGGVVVAYEVAKALKVPLNVFVVRKLGVPGHEELAMGAIASGGVHFLNESVVQTLHILQSQIEEVTKKEQKELERRERMYHGTEPPLSVVGREVILIDDGLATGATMYAAVKALRKQKPKKIIVVVPVAAEETCNEFRLEVDEMICLYTPESFFGVGMWYEHFEPTTDAEVRRLLLNSGKAK
ncbi:MAG: phosphoribosyltransferase [Candidatus Omnitrophica bacterium]|nr:phosphoribosyltransferase [Candidatus Omnitrophota bacterium]